MVDTAAAVLSNLADYGVVWVAIAAGKGVRPGPRRRRTVAALAIAGFSSLFVNKAVKAAVARERPVQELRQGPRNVIVRAPTSSSFPSGHTLAATCTAIVLSENRVETGAFLFFAVTVAASRIHIRHHHPSDVIGGLIIGAALGTAGRALLNRFF